MSSRPRPTLSIASLALLVLAASVRGAPTQLADSPLSSASSVPIPPNILFVLDDSGSMDWAYLPDWATAPTDFTQLRNASYNGVAYNPALTYTPPKYFTASGQPDTTTYPVQTSAVTTGWTQVLYDGYKQQSVDITIGYCSSATYKCNLVGNAYYVTTEAGEYCTDERLQTCNAQTAPSPQYPIAAKLRWCKTASDASAAVPPAGACQATRIQSPATVTFTNARMPAARQATLTIGGSKSTQVTSVKINGTEILSGNAPASSTTNSSLLAQGIRDRINDCTGGKTGKCQVGGYRAAVTGSTVTIMAPSKTVTGTPAVTTAQSPANAMTITPTAFAKPATNQAPGEIALTVIDPALPLPPAASTRSDCAASPCTYSEEMTNFANWWAYYRTRMQTMKTASSQAFETIGSTFRVGYMSINNNTGTDFQNIDSFTGAQKKGWYDKLFAAEPNNNTPLRAALANAGRIYAGKLNGQTFNGVQVNDPVQYYCQANVTILSTDGYWNTGPGFKLDGSTAVGDQDGPSSGEVRPQLDGGATPDTLSDVAQYYWKTDLRDPALSNCSGAVVAGVQNNVCTNDPLAPRQYMSTYTLGLGASGFMQYRSDYLTATKGDFYSVSTGQTANPAAAICPWQTSGACNWPAPASNAQTNIDDLWHAAVNGRGVYFSATDPLSLSSGISGALTAITVKAGALAAVTVTSPNLAAGANDFFEVSFTVGDWSGEVVKRTINGTTGALSPTPAWSAQQQLDNLVGNAPNGHLARTIYTYNPPSGPCPAVQPATADNLKPFLWANLCPNQQAYFTKPYINSLAQFCTGVGGMCLASATQTAASGQPLVNFLRGDKSNEGQMLNASTYYRQRTHLLGDIVGSEAVYVKEPQFNYADFGYGSFKTANQTRTAMVYVAANDGMLHALDAATGNESWAYVPSMVMGRLFRLADKTYSMQGVHQFTVDGTPVAGDICVSNCTSPAAGPAVWKTILVGGLNNGGRGYYALDITNPAAPKALWEFSEADDANLGYTYGNPVISKLKNGTWVVMFTSGYNNINLGDGKGYLYVLNANTGSLIRTIPTNVGSTTTPSGLARIAAWANFPDQNNTTQRVYGGDQIGNVWRFDVNGDITPIGAPVAYDAQRLAQLKDTSGASQPVTARPELGKVDSYSMVFVATGQLLGLNDLLSTQRQTVYGIKDKLDDLTPDYGNPRTATGSDSFVQQTLTASTCPTGNPYCTAGDPIVTASNNPVDLSIHGGWYADFPLAGERVNTDLRLQLGTLAFHTNTPTLGACVPIADSRAYFLDYRSGSFVQGTNGLAGVLLGHFLASAPSIVRLADGTIRDLVRTDVPSTVTLPIPTASTLFTTRRISWRELVTE
ncbi:PilC/PilY family type IV pilus protein [Accumulibacter sp.]|uniref:PilC/PilY family type IV pilus protein n=1 Tax=Accumulibacter sp. TaxID=2053492 RepID=UPI0025DEAE00|nr:PilC/PilY family type IV pilus protein [Accumulibacter sp.]MCM8594787.1 PilC/PilY family type IV pilus protein [Accumulibacter sp.]MCM8625108.1 PilC/PilY family type IV pilus protein [Accumulibacter sp.]MDS4048932.1 PilC/PilY family type IV pilus protein [Accumulibacter sp.]